MAKIKITLTPEQAAYVAAEKQRRKLANREKRKQLKKKMGQNGWKVFEGENLPAQACTQIHRHSAHSNMEDEHHNIFTYPGCWIIGWTYYKGDNPETATEWIVTTDNGGFYKVGAQFMIWQIGHGGSQACWSSAACKKSLKSLLTEGVTVSDPGYTT